jgi:hypothetical protein
MLRNVCNLDAELALFYGAHGSQRGALLASPTRARRLTEINFFNLSELTFHPMKAEG